MTNTEEMRDRSRMRLNLIKGEILDRVLEYIAISESEFRSKTRKQEVVCARKLVEAILHQMFHIHEDVSAGFIGVDRTTILFYRRNFDKDYQWPLFRNGFLKIRDNIKHLTESKLVSDEYKEFLEKEIERCRASIKKYNQELESIRRSESSSSLQEDTQRYVSGKGTKTSRAGLAPFFC